MKTNVLAHRGASGYAPENTMEAFRLAREMGADGIELDVHLTKDNEVVVIHDALIDRTSNGTGNCEKMTYEELLKYDFSYKFSDKYPNVKIPLLKEVCKFIKETDMILNIEIKFASNIDNGIEKKVVDIIQEYDLVDKIIISSFNHISLFRIKSICPELVTAPLYSSNIFKPWDYAKTFSASGIHPAKSSVNEDLIANCKSEEMFVNVWTVDDPSQIEGFAKMGVDSVITNVPDVARKIYDKL